MKNIRDVRYNFLNEFLCSMYFRCTFYLPFVHFWFACYFVVHNSLTMVHMICLAAKRGESRSAGFPKRPTRPLEENPSMRLTEVGTRRKSNVMFMSCYHFVGSLFLHSFLGLPALFHSGIVCLWLRKRVFAAHFILFVWKYFTYSDIRQRGW